jgi:hypothetical protein
MKPTLYLETTIVYTRRIHARVELMSEKDPIVEEVHAAREAIAKEGGYNLERIIEAANARQVESGRPVVRLPAKKVEVTKKAS